MKFDSKLLLEQLIRTHILEQSIVTDTNVKRGKVGSATSYGSIDSPSNVSSADRSFFDKVNSIKRTNPKSKRPYIKLYSNVTKGGTASENDRLQSVAGVARREASTLIDRFGGPGALSEYSAIISKPQDAKKQADASSTVSYDPSAKLYYTVVFIMTSDINTTISPEWGVTGTMKFFGEDQISSLKPVVTTKDDEVIDDKSKFDQETEQEKQTEPINIEDDIDLNNLADGTTDSKRLQELIYQALLKFQDAGELTTTSPVFQNFVKYRQGDATKWDGKIAYNTKMAVKWIREALGESGSVAELKQIDLDFIKVLREIAKDGISITESMLSLKNLLLKELNEQIAVSKKNIEKANQSYTSTGGTSSSGTRSSSTSVKYRGKFASKAVEDLYKIIVQAQNSAKEDLGKDLIVRSAPQLSAVTEEKTFEQIKQTISTEHVYAEDESRLVITDFDCYVKDADESLTVIASISVNTSLVHAAFTIASNKIKMNSDSGVLNLNSKIIEPIGVVGVTGNVTLIDYFMNPFKYLSLNVNDEYQLKAHLEQMNDWTRNIAVSIKNFISDNNNFDGYTGWNDDEAGAWTDVVMKQWNYGVPSMFPEDPRFAHSWNGQVNQLQTLVNQLNINIKKQDSGLTAIVQKFQTDVDSYRNMFKTGSVFYNKFHGGTANDTYRYGYHVANPAGTGVSYQNISVDTDFG